MESEAVSALGKGHEKQVTVERLRNGEPRLPKTVHLQSQAMEPDMTWDHVEAAWQEVSGLVKARWSRLVDDESMGFAGTKRATLAHMQKRYGLRVDDARQCMGGSQRRSRKAGDDRRFIEDDQDEDWD